MRKGLLILSALAIGVASSQAQAVKSSKLSKAAQPQKMVKVNTSKQEIAPILKKGTNRAGETVSLLYSYPQGAFFYGLSDNAYSFTAMQAITGAFEDTEFTNYSRITAADGSRTRINEGLTWQFFNSTTGAEITPQAQRTDEYGSLIAQGYGIYPFPTLSYGTDSYIYEVEEEGEDNVPAYWNCGTAGIANYEFSDGNGGVETYTGSIGNASAALGFYSGFGGDYCFRSNSTFYNLEGYAETRQWNNTGKKLVGFGEYYSKPFGHVYAESVVAWFRSSGIADQTKALNGQNITATIYTFGENGMVEYASATATDQDVTFIGTNGLCYIDFKFVENDPIMGEVEAPINLPEEDFFVILSGFDQVSGTFQAPFASSDGFTGYAYALLEDGSISTIGYSNDAETPQVNLYIGFRAAMPVAKYDEDNLEAVLFTAEGGEGAGMYDATEEKYYLGSLILTMTPADAWECIEKPDWISNIEWDATYIDNGYMVLVLTAEALPEGTESRNGEVVFEVYGKQLNIPVYQATDPTGIKGVTINRTSLSGTAYNLAGQRVADGYKGLVIKDGKKFFVK